MGELWMVSLISLTLWLEAVRPPFCHRNRQRTARKTVVWEGMMAGNGGRFC